MPTQAWLTEMFGLIFSLSIGTFNFQAKQLSLLCVVDGGIDSVGAFSANKITTTNRPNWSMSSWFGKTIDE